MSKRKRGRTAKAQSLTKVRPKADGQPPGQKRGGGGDAHADAQRAHDIQETVSTALSAPQQQDQAGEARLRMDIDRREINWLHLPTTAAIDIKPAIACFQRSAYRR
jgi:hypothetical protein